MVKTFFKVLLDENGKVVDIEPPEKAEWVDLSKKPIKVIGMDTIEVFLVADSICVHSGCRLK